MYELVIRSRRRHGDNGVNDIAHANMDHRVNVAFELSNLLFFSYNHVPPIKHMVSEILIKLIRLLSESLAVIAIDCQTGLSY